MSSRARRARLAALTLTCALTAALPPSAGAVSVGVVDHVYWTNDVAHMTTGANWTASKRKKARIAVPWDIALRPATDPTRADFQSWLDGLTLNGGEPYVTFVITRGFDAWTTKATKAGSGMCYTNAAGTVDCYTPDVASYTSAVRAFLTAFPQVKIIGAWNEPNYNGRDVPTGVPADSDLRYYTPDGAGLVARATCPSDPTPNATNCGPALVARYWQVLQSEMAKIPACGVVPRCLAVAGEFTGTPPSTTGLISSGYWESYQWWLAHIAAPRPYIWAAHPYGDKPNFSMTKEAVTGKWLGPNSVWYTSTEAQFSGEVSHFWPSATGADFSFGASTQAGLLQDYVDSPTAGVEDVTSLNGSTGGRVPRVYVYNWQDKTAAGKDYGLLYPPDAGGTLAGTRRPAFTTIAGMNP